MKKHFSIKKFAVMLSGIYIEYFTAIICTITITVSIVSLTPNAGDETRNSGKTSKNTKPACT